MNYYKPSPNGNPYIDISFYREFVAATDDQMVIGGDSHKIAVVMLYGAVHGMFNGRLLAWITNTNQKLTSKAVRNLKASKIWQQRGKKKKTRIQKLYELETRRCSF